MHPKSLFVSALLPSLSYGSRQAAETCVGGSADLSKVSKTTHLNSRASHPDAHSKRIERGASRLGAKPEIP